MADPYRTAAAERDPVVHKPRPVWHYTAAAAYVCLWGMALLVQSSDWSEWRVGAFFMLAIHGIALGGYSGAKAGDD